MGNYTVAADSFQNKVLNRRLRTLQTLFKDHQFITQAGVCDGRFNSKVGWARGFDSYRHGAQKWGRTFIPGFEWLTGTCYKFRDYDKFIFAHIDYLHEPLVCPAADPGRWLLYDLGELSRAGEPLSPEIYFLHLQLLDSKLGQLLDFLVETGEYESTAILLTSDHGCGLSWKKHSEYSLYEERIRVPLIIKYPSWAAEQLPTRPLTNSISEIFRVAHSLLGSSFPEDMNQLPQYSEELSHLAYAETIMNPGREYQRHNLVLMDHHHKYVCWNRIDWDLGRVEEYGEERLYGSDDTQATYDEDSDLGGEFPEVLQRFRKMARQALASNLDFLREFPPQLY